MFDKVIAESYRKIIWFIGILIMSVHPLGAAPALIQVHTFAAFGAAALTISIFSMPRGTLWHRRLGWAWVCTMALAALTSFGITEMRQGQLGPIHVLSVATLGFLVLGVVRARRRQIAGHRRTMLGLTYGALCVAGAFTLLPGRLMHTVLFGQ